MKIKSLKQWFLITTLLIVVIFLFFNFILPLSNKYKAYVFSLQNDVFKEKVWAHRVDSIGKAREVTKFFRGIEVDIVYNNKKHVFDVNHPPAKSINLSLEDLLRSINDPSAFSYWLDYKNLENKNSKLSIERLIELCRIFKINKETIIVESTNHNLLSIFRQYGFLTSYYLPTNFFSALEKKDYQNFTIREKKILSKLRDDVKYGDFDYISTDRRYYSFVCKMLSTKKDILLWDTSIEYYKLSGLIEIKKIISNEKRVKVLLTKFKSKYNR